MKIGYVDLNYTTFYEDYSIEPARYGGGRVFASWCKEFFDFTIFGCPETFNNLKPTEAKTKCVGLSPSQMRQLLAGEPLAIIAPEFHDIDLFVYPHTNTYLNLDGLRAKQCTWSAGVEEPIHPNHKYLILYNDYQNPKIQSPNTKVFKFTLGTKLPDFSPRRKEDFIFQCSRHVECFCSVEVADFCLRNNITAYFAGPIEDGYPLLKYIDNKRTFYLGEITENVKRDYLARARLCTLLHNWPTPFSLSAIEALAYGTPIACVGFGFWPSLITEKNGFYVRGEEGLLEAWNKAKEINQRECYASVLPYSHLNMIQSVNKAFKEIIDSK